MLLCNPGEMHRSRCLPLYRSIPLHTAFVQVALKKENIHGQHAY
jgi:hypothetical protein